MQKEFKFEQLNDELLDFNYKYLLYGAITKLFKDTYGEIGSFLHDSSDIKMFSFSSINSAPSVVFKKEENKLKLGNRIFIRFSSTRMDFLSMLEDALNKNPILDLNGKKIKFVFSCNLNTPEFKNEMTWIPFFLGSIVTRGKLQNEYITPNDIENCKESLKKNLIRKYQIFVDELSGLEKNMIKNQIGFLDPSDNIDFEFLGKLKLRINKNYKKNGDLIKILSWACPVKVIAPKIIQKIIFDTGLGSLNSQGYGLVTTLNN